MNKVLNKVHVFRGSPKIPGDKSISHRGLILGALAEGVSEVYDILEGEDVQSTARCLRQLGVTIVKEGHRTIISGIGGKDFLKPTSVLDCGNSGTTMRVMMGVLCGHPGFEATLTGDASLVKRPMKRVSNPLRQMGADFTLTQEDYAPLVVKGQKLRAIDYELKIASAQIKTAIIMAALNAEGVTRIFGEIDSRDHTERLLPHFGCPIQTSPQEILVIGGQKLKANKVMVPSDPSTAAFWIGAAILIENSFLEMENISLNPTRIGFFEVMKRMGANITTKMTSHHPEPVGEIRVEFSDLRGVLISKKEVPSLIDEIPLIAVLATQAQGVTEVRGAEELRVKESDRIEAVASNLRNMGCEIEVFPDGFRIVGPQKLHGASIKTFHDHRIAMAFSVASMVAEGETTICDAECVAVSYPDFFETLQKLTH